MVTHDMTLSYDLELQRQGTQGGLAAADRGKTVDDGWTGGRTRSSSTGMVARTLDTAFVPMPGHLHMYT